MYGGNIKIKIKIFNTLQVFPLGCAYLVISPALPREITDKSQLHKYNWHSEKAEIFTCILSSGSSVFMASISRA